MIKTAGRIPPVLTETETTPKDRAESLAVRDRYLRNLRWFSSHAAEIGKTHVGKFVCVAGEELFVGSVPEEVLAEARRRHPGDAKAIFYKLISHHRGSKIYANFRLLAAV